MSESNLFKDMNINVGQLSLIEQIVNPTKIMKGSSNVNDIGRVGLKSSPRENLYADWGVKETDIESPVRVFKADDVPLKNTHGEKFHKDNDKEVEKLVTKVDEVKYPKETPVSLSVDSCLDDLIKGDDSYIGGDKENSSDGKDEQVEEEEKEIRAEKEKKISVREFRASLDEVYNLVKGCDKKKSGSGDYESAMNMSDEEMAKKIKRGIHENSVGMKEKKKKPSYKSELDETVDMIKASKKGGGPDNKSKSVSPKRGFIKAVGPGGIQFDFGYHTGNPVADNYNDILWKNLEKVQSDIAESQAVEHNKAVTGWVNKGEDTYMKDHGVVRKLDGANKEQSVETPMEKSNDIRDQFHNTSVNIGGEIVEAKSETDMYVLKQHEEMFKSQEGDGQIVDVTGGSGNGVVIDAVTGIAYDAITNKEVKVK